jgi:hypothetical protein
MTPPSTVFVFSKSERSLLILAKHMRMVYMEFLFVFTCKTCPFSFRDVVHCRCYRRHGGCDDKYGRPLARGELILWAPT